MGDVGFGDWKHAPGNGRIRDHDRPERHDRPGAAMAAVITPALDWAVADLARPGQRESGDRSVVLPTADGWLAAAVDGLGHGAEAASAAAVAVKALELAAHRPVVQI